MEVRAGFEGDVDEHMKGADGWFSAPRFITSAMADAKASHVIDVKIPEGDPHYGSLAGKTVQVMAYFVYPTTKDNPRPGYTFPYTNTGDNFFTHMHRPGDKPLPAEPGKRLPVIVFSHGYNAHGLWDLDRLKRHAARGYLCVNIFHGDGRFGMGDNLKLRPIEVRQVIDHLLADPDFGPLVDPERIGVEGASFGGYTLLACLGGRNPEGTHSDHDPRIKAGLGLVPFTSAWWSNPFGKDWAGLSSVKAPYLAVYAGEDKNVPPETVLGSIARCTGPRMAVCLDGEGHLLSDKAWKDVPTWEMIFWDAWLKDDPVAKSLLEADTSVEGGVNDHVTFRGK